MALYGSEQHVTAPTIARRCAHRLLGTYDVGALVRSAAVESALRAIPPPARILDAGCGRGQFAFALHRRWPSAQIVGVDFDPDLVAHCDRIASRLRTPGALRFERRTLPDELNATFDLVVCVDVLEHIDDDQGFLQCLYAATAPRGTLVLHTPSTPQRRYLSEFEEQHDHVRDGYDMEGLRTLILGAGYGQVEARYTFGPLGAFGWEIFALARRGNAAAKPFLPFAYGCAMLDGLRRPQSGNGLLVVASKN
jgi:2-polyprenyl-3-methyl-5-hydroxy-6-metoxy-1,4-benzoquinol methylase